MPASRCATTTRRSRRTASASSGCRTRSRRRSTSTTTCCSTPSRAGTARRYLRSRGFDGDVARRFSLGWSPDGLRRAERAPPAEEVLARRHRRRGPRVREQGEQAPGLVPGPRDVPDLGRARRAGRLRRPHARRAGPEVQEHRGDGALPEVPAALRAALGEGRDRRARRGRDLRGLHRRDGVRARGRAERGRHVRHRARRRALPHAEEPRAQGDPRVRRRRRGAGRGRALLPVGAALRGAVPGRRSRSRPRSGRRVAQSIPRRW